MRSPLTHTLINLLLVLSLVLPAGAVPTAQAYNAAPSTIKAPPAPVADSGLYRTHITVDSPARWAQLETLGIVILERYDVSALVLVDGAQLETLARLRFQPQASDELNALLQAQGEGRQWLSTSMGPVLEKGLALQALRAEADELSAQAVDAAAAELRAALHALSPEQVAGVASSISPDSDGDGLTNTEESWWCTDPMNQNSDGDAQGYTDGQEVEALLDVTQPRNVRWGYGPPFGPPNAWPNFNNRDGSGVKVCNDGDFDTIPDYAEAYMVGTRVPSETTDLDKFDDGQELFGITYCPGAPTNCGYGSYPAIEYWNFIKASMPNWVLPPGDSPLVAAFPVPEVYVTPGSWTVERVTTITTTEGEMTQSTHSYETAVTRGESTSIADTVTWNEWEEVSEAIERPLANTFLASQSTDFVLYPVINWGKTLLGGSVLVLGAVGGAAICAGSFGTACALGAVGGAVATSYGWDKLKEGWNEDTNKDTDSIPQTYRPEEISCVASPAPAECTGPTTEVDESLLTTQSLDYQGIATSLDGVQFAIDKQGALLARGLQDVAYAISQPRITETKTNGKSWGGAQTTTHEVYEEHTISEGEAFATGQNWSTAWAVDSSHAADLSFDYSIKNTGTEYARELTNLVFNIYIGDDTEPTISYPAWEQFAGGKLENLFPVGPNTPPGVGSTKTFASTKIPLSLEEMKRIDLGERLTIKVENYSYGADELFYTDAINGGVTVFIEDGVEDGNETVDQYVIPTWGVESVQDVLTRYFPHGEDIDGNLNALWTPEFDGINAPAWHEHFLSDIAWWNVYLTQADAGNTPLQQLPAQAGSGLLFRFNRDSDRDGYNDRAEFRYYCALPDTNPDHVHCADGHLKPEIHPQPEVLAGYVSKRAGDTVTVTLVLQNTGTFDAYGIDAVMYSPDATTTIGNNTVGGNGKVRPGNQVAVGSIVKAPDLGDWGGSTSKPYAGGNYSGDADRTYTFSVQTAGVVGQPGTAMTWDDGAGGSGALALGDAYHSPLPITVDRGIEVGFNSGFIAAGASFTVDALTPRDTFTYTIESVPVTPPVIVVSYSDPQGSHRFITPVELADMDASLAPHTGEMLEGLRLEVAATAALQTDSTNTTNLVVTNPHPQTIEGGHLYLNFVSDGVLVLEQPHTLDLPAGPTVFSADWSVADFSADYNPDGDNILIAFWTDSEDNIIDSAARPFNTFADDPRPAFAMAAEDETWDFGTAQQGTLMQRRFELASIGYMDLLTYVGDVDGLSVQGPTLDNLLPGDMGVYTLTLNTQDLPVGPFSETIPVRTSDPANPTRVVRVTGTVTAAAADTPVGTLQRPLDWPAPVSGTQGQWVEFAHTLGPEPQTLHPVKVYSQDYASLKGVGKYATPFGAGTASYDMFGDGRDGVMPSSGNLDYNNGVGVGVVNSGGAGSYTLNVTDVYGVWRINPGDAVLIHQTQGSGAGCWEINRAVSDFGGGTATYQLQNPLKCNYASGGNNHAQIQRVPQYTDCPVSGTVTPLTGWNGTWGGILAVMCNGTMSMSGTILSDGGNGATASDGDPSGGSGGGFRGGRGNAVNNDNYGSGESGEGTPGWGTWGGGANGNGGGAGGGSPQTGNFGTGGGGGNGTSGGASTAGGIGVGGNAAGNPELTNMVFGGGGGGSNDNPGNSIGGGGGGGGIVVLQAPTINVSGVIHTNGGQAGGNKWAGGGGAGGSILLRGKHVNVGTSRITAVGGAARASGGAGAVGRIRIEYCDTNTGTTSPSASAQKLNCYAAEQIESAPYNRARLNLPATGTSTYQIQYGRKLNWGGAANQVTTLRVPAGLFTSVTLQALVSDLPSNAWFALDVGNTGADSWNGTVGNGGEYGSPNLAAYFNAYWASHGAPTTGTLDVPVRVYLDRAGQVLLTNLQVTPTGSKARAIRLPVRPLGYSNVAASFTVSGGAGPLAVGVDVGGDGTIDWTYTGAPAYPAALTTGNLATAVNAYLASVGGQPSADVPLRFHLAPFATLNLTGFTATPVGGTDASISAGDITFSAPTPTEGNEVTVSATIHNTGALDTGPLVVAFYATPPGQSETQIGSALVPAVAPGSQSPISIPWHTLGFTGDVPVRVVVDPFDRVAETNEANNQATANLTIRTRPDLHIPSPGLETDPGIALDDAEPVTGQAVQVAMLVQNNGQTGAGASTLVLSVEDPNGAASQICAPTPAVPGQSSATETCAWTPSLPGRHRLYAAADDGGAVNESNESNNRQWRDVYVGFAGPLQLDSGGASDSKYSASNGYGYIDEGAADTVSHCGSAPHQTYRHDPGGAVLYRFDHLLPGHFYHLDLVLFDCAPGAGRQQYVKINGYTVAGPINLSDGQVHRLSLLVDPALYTTRSIVVTVSESESGLGAIVNEISLHDIDYRYADAGSGNDPAYNAERGHGWLDTPAISSWGSRPFETARVDQADNEIRYRFDNLDPGKRYLLRFTFYQGSGVNRMQQIRVNGQSLGADFTLVSGQTYIESRDVPLSAYSTNPDIIASVVRLDTSVGPLISEIALEQRTQASTAACQITATPYRATARGNVTILGQPAPAGSVITAENPRGEVVGCMVTTSAGIYIMTIYGEDTTATPPIPGMRAGEQVIFRVDGSLAVAGPTMVWQNGQVVWVNLDAGAIQGQSILLNPNWNLFSINLQPPATTLSTVLGSISGKYCRVLAENSIYDCTVPERFHTLKDILPGRGYWLRLEGGASANLQVQGTQVDPATPINLHQGWNWIGYLPAFSQPIADALAGIAGDYLWVADGAGSFYDPLFPDFSNLHLMEPGKGYLLYATTDTTLIYPNPVAATGAAGVVAASAVCQEAQPTPYFMVLFGGLTFDGQPAPVGVSVHALTARGEVAGCFQVNTAGQYGFVPIFGADTVDPPVPGFFAGEPITLLVDGLPVSLPEPLLWRDSKAPQRLDLHLPSPQRLYLPTIRQ